MSYLWKLRILIVLLILNVLLLMLVSGSAIARDEVNIQVPETVGVGDKLAIDVFGHSELSGNFEIDSSGAISLPLIGRVPVAGSDVALIDEVITDKLKDGFLINPQVNVKVFEYRPIYILGGIRSPGSYPYVPGMTVMVAVALAGGYALLIEPQDVRSHVALIQSRRDVATLSSDHQMALIRRARLLAERDGLNEMSLPETIKRLLRLPGVKEAVTSEQRLLTTRIEGAKAKVEFLEQQIVRYRDEVSVLEAQITAINKQIESVQAQITLFGNLAQKGTISRIDLMELQRTDSDLAVRRLEVMARISRLRQQIGEAELDIINVQNSYQEEIISQLHDLNRRVSGLAEQLQAAKEILRQNAVIADQATSNLTGQELNSITIVRQSEDSLQVLAVSETSLVLAGDIIRIPGFVSTLPLSEIDALRTMD